MAAKYWIKLYHEMLDDPKMGRLPDTVYRRCIELFLYAGELDNDGHLPCTNDIAWRLLRQNEASDEFIESLEHLESVGILERTDTGWLVVKFQDRQAPVSDAERQRQFRNRQRNNGQSLPETVRDGESNGGVTNRDTDKIRIDKNRVEEIAPTGAEKPTHTGDVKKLEDLCEAVAVVCVLDLQAIPDNTRRKVASAAAYLLERGVEPGQVARFRKWWRYDDAPYPSQVQSEWLKFEEALGNGKANGRTDHAHTPFSNGLVRSLETDEERRRKLEALKKMNDLTSQLAVQ